MSFFSRPQSTNAAVKIVQPQPTDYEDKSKPQLKKDTTQRQCRNILIHGSCRFQDKGCIYYHPPVSEEQSTTPRPESPLSATLSQAVNAPVFVPKATLNTFSPPSTPPVHPSLASPSHSSPSSSISNYQDNTAYESYGLHASTSALDDLSSHMQGLDTDSYGGNSEEQSYYQSDYDEHMLSMGAFYPVTHTQNAFVRQPLNYHLYTHPIPDTFSPNHFISDSLREELQQRSEATRTVAPGLNLPEELQGYHTLVPLEAVGGERRKFLSWYSTIYRATNITDGMPYTLRRVENFRLMHQIAFNAIEMWSRIRHPNVVRVKEAFTTRSFQDNSLIVVYDYHPNPKTLYEEHIRPKTPTFQNGRLQNQTSIIPERVLWSYIIQLTNAIGTIHAAGLAVRTIDATKILVTGKNRLRIGSCGVVDVLMYDSRQDLAMLQQEDLVLLGRLLFALCCNNLAVMGAIPKALETLTRNYSSDIKNIVLYLISKPGPHKTMSQVIDMIGKSRLLAEMEEVQQSGDRLESELMSELENGRLVRLLCKFGFINERPEFLRQPRWSETGDRYIIKLFRDYVFHQVDENGNPVVNWTHVLVCLNKLDCGTDERIMLVSRDEQSCLVVSYREVKSCIEGAFSDLARASR